MTEKARPEDIITVYGYSSNIVAPVIIFGLGYGLLLRIRALKFQL